MSGNELNDDLVNDIASDVLGVLERSRFFECLDERFYSIQGARVLQQCSGSHEVSTEILRDLKMNADDIRDILAVLRSRGGCCDCEVLYNVASESNLRSDYWKARATGESPHIYHSNAQTD